MMRILMYVIKILLKGDGRYRLYLYILDVFIDETLFKCF